MAATNYTPIQLYHSTTASASPTAGNLVNGELAINILDGKLYYKDNGGVVQVIATKGTGTIGGSTTQVQYNNAGALAGSANFTFNGTTATINTLNLTNALGAAYGGTAQSTYAQGDLLYASAANTLAKLPIGINTYILTSNGTIPGWSIPSSVVIGTATNLAGGAAGSVPYQSGASTTTFLSIGTVNQVITSTGSAPQWSSALTLTGLSNSGLTTLDKTVTVGNTSFNGAAVFAPATPAKVYLGTGTVTDVTSAIAATNAAGAIVALGITPIAATNANVTYTNASTLYIAGAPSAGTNITITNPYALYVAAGDAYFGGTVTAGTVNLTTLDLTNLEVTNIKAKDGTASMTLADTTGIITLSATAGTANGVAYLNGSRALTTGSALTFDGTKLGVASGNIDVVSASFVGSPLIAARFNASNLRMGIGIGNSNGFPFLGVNVNNAANDNGTFDINGYASRIRLDNGVFQVQTSSASGTAGNAITWTTPLYLDSSGNLGVGQTSPSYKLDVSGIVRISNGGDSYFGFGANKDNYFTTGTTSGKQVWRNSAGSEYMTLDSSGNLVVGTTGTAQGRVHAHATTNAQFVATDATLGATYGGVFRGYGVGAQGGYAELGVLDNGTFTKAIQVQQQATVIAFFTGVNSAGNAERARIDSSGNLGLGVTPSAWGTSSQKAIEVILGALSYRGAGNTESTVTHGAYYDGTNWKYAATSVGAARYQMIGANAGSSHTWSVSAGGTKDNTISFTQAMTLDSSGNLLVGETSSNSGNNGLKVKGQFALTTSQAFTASGSVNDSAYYIVCYSLSATCTLTLPTPANNTGRLLNIVVQSAQQVVSASSNVTAITNGALGTAILPATAGKWAQLWCDGTYWNIIATNV